MSEMVERVARAIDPLVEELCKERGVFAGENRAIARAAIEAMREPTDAMLTAGLPLIVTGKGMAVDKSYTGLMWQDMVDEALK